MINEWSVHPSLSFVDGAPFSTLFNDLYKSRNGAFDEAREAFIAGCRLSERWRSSFQYTILELGFGLGVNFLATWQHWKLDPNRPARLHYLAIEKHPVRADDLDLALGRLGAHQEYRQRLVAQWPWLMAGLHRLSFEDERVNLLLCIGDAQYWLKQLSARVSSVYLDGFNPTHNPAIWQQSIFTSVARLCHPGASLASYSSAPTVRHALEAAGFDVNLKPGFAGKHHRIEASLNRSFATLPSGLSLASSPNRERYGDGSVGDKSVMVIGAGLAGSAMSRALRRRGWQVTLIDDPQTPLLGSSQPFCAEHLHVSPDDNLLARLTRSAWQLSRSGQWLSPDRPPNAATCLATQVGDSNPVGPAIETTSDAPLAGKMMLLHNNAEYDRWLRILPELKLPSEFVRLLDRTQTLTQANWSPMANSKTLCGSIWFPDARGADPGRLCRRWQSKNESKANPASIRFIRQRVDQLKRASNQWSVFDNRQTLLATASVVIFCNAADAPRLLPIASIESENIAGQSTLIRSRAGAPATALGGAAYLCPVGADRFLIGASFEAAHGFVANDSGDAENFKRLSQSVGIAENDLRKMLAPAVVSRHAGARCATRDRMPVIGRWPDEAAASADAERLLKNSKLALPILPNVYANFGYGARGLLWCVLGAELIGAMLDEEPLPLARDLSAAIDPSRSVRRWLRSR